MALAFIVAGSAWMPAAAYARSDFDARAIVSYQARSPRAKAKLNISKICVGQSKNLKIAGAQNRVRWKSKNNDIAEVSASGLLNAKKTGTAVVVARIGRRSFTYNISVLAHQYRDATCTEPKTCMRCGATDGDPLGHQYKPATCTDPQICIRCGDMVGVGKGHQYKNATCTTPVTCVVCGETTGKALGHQYKDATCTEPKTCTRCGKQIGTALGHKYKDATCVNPKICTVCGATEGMSLGHQYKDATCTTPATCIRCGATQGDPLGHQFDTANGQIVGTKGSLQGMKCTCTRCGTTQQLSADQLPLRIKLQYHSTAGFDGENASVLQSVYSILDQIITPGMSDDAKVRAIHDYLIYQANYYEGDLDRAPRWVWAVKGVVQNGSGACNSYALAFYTMATAEGIPCRFISGRADNGISVGGHAWDQVYLGGTWYYIDCTWDDPYGGGAENDRYYLSQTLWSDHTQSSVSELVDENEIVWKQFYLCG